MNRHTRTRAIRGILRPTQPHVINHHPHNRRVTFNVDHAALGNELHRCRSYHSSGATSLAAQSGYAEAGSVRSQWSGVSSVAPRSGYSDAGSFKPENEDVIYSRGRQTEQVVDYLCRKVGVSDTRTFDALCARQLGKVWVEVRRLVGEGDERVEERMKRSLLEEERVRKTDKGKWKRQREVGKELLGGFVERFVGVRRGVFQGLGGREMGRLVITAVSVALKERRRGGGRIR